MSANSATLVSTLIYHEIARVDMRVAEAFRRTFVEPQDPAVETQIAAANEYWRLRLGQISTAASIQAREALVDCDLESWLRLFSTHVVPRLVRMDLTF